MENQLFYPSPEQAGAALATPVVAIGNFDGVHRGHVAVIERTIAEAQARHADSAVLTFEPHPVLYFRPDTPEFRLTTLDQKTQLLTAHGLAAVVAAPFDETMAMRSPAQFVEQVLAAQLHASAVLVGEDFRFGKGRVGDIAQLRSLSAQHGIDVITLEQVRESDHVISSTRIRAALAVADLRTVAELLGRPYAIHGVVEHGEHLGRTFGFPTANIASENPLLPPDGIYASRLKDGTLGELGAATYVGTRPAVGGTHRVVEAFCLDAPTEFDLYDHRVELEFIARVREDADFKGVEALIAQMHVDVAEVRRVLASQR